MGRKCHWPVGGAGPGSGRRGHAALDLLQLPERRQKMCGEYDNMRKLPQDRLRLTGNLLVWRGWGEVGEVLTPGGKLVFGLKGQTLGLHNFLGNPLDADILIESHLARLGNAGVLGPQTWWSLHLKWSNLASKFIYEWLLENMITQ